MDRIALKTAALLLREKLDLYTHKDPAAALLLSDLNKLLSMAELESIKENMEPRDIPGHRLFEETNLRMLGDLKVAYANFYIELIGGRDWSSYKLIESRMREDKNRQPPDQGQDEIQ